MKKKLLLFGFVFVTALLVSGCGVSKKVVCTQKASGVDIVFNVGFLGKDIKSMDFSYDMDLSNYTDTQITYIEKQDFCTLAKTAMSEYKNAFEDCKQSVKDKHLKVSAALDVNEIKKDKGKYKLTSPEEAKKQIEKSGYSCTIK